MDLNTLAFIVVIGALSISFLGIIITNHKNGKRKEKIKQLDHTQFILYIKWCNYVRPDIANVSLNEAQKERYQKEGAIGLLEEWEWEVLKHDPYHREIFDEWCSARLDLYEFEPNLLKEHMKDATILAERMSPELSDRFYNLLFCS